MQVWHTYEPKLHACRDIDIDEDDENDEDEHNLHAGLSCIAPCFCSTSMVDLNSYDRFLSSGYIRLHLSETKRRIDSLHP